MIDTPRMIFFNQYVIEPLSVNLKQESRGLYYQISQTMVEYDKVHMMSKQC